MWIVNQSKTYVYDTKLFNYFFVQASKNGYGIFGRSKNGNDIILGEFDNEEVAKCELIEMGKGIASSESTLIFPLVNNVRGIADVGVPTM